MSDTGAKYKSATYGSGVPQSGQREYEANRRARDDAWWQWEAANVVRDVAHGLGIPENISAVPRPATYGVAQQLRAPGKQFSRSDILAIIRAQRAVAGNVADAEYGKLLAIFESIE